MKAQNNKKQPKTSKTFLQRIEEFSRNRYVILTLLMIISIVFVSNYSSIYDKKLDLNGDNIYYFALGKSLADGDGFSTPFGYKPAPHNHFPPGYPAFVSCVIKVFGDDVETVKKMNGFLLYLSVLLLFFIVLTSTKNSILAFCAAILTSMHTDLLRFGTIMMSEPLYIFLSLLAIFLALLLSRWNINEKKRWVFIILSLLFALTIAYIYFVRTIGLAVILAIIGWSGLMAIISFIKWRKALKTDDKEEILLHRNLMFIRLGIAFVACLACGTAKLSWDQRNKNLGFSKNDYVETFKTKQDDQMMTGIDDWKVRIKSNSTHFIGRWIPSMVYFKPVVDENENETVEKKELIYGLLLLTLLVIGCCSGYGNVMLLFYVIITVGVLTLYTEQYGGTRYITPLAPVFIVMLLNSCNTIIEWIFKLRKAKTSPFWLQALATIIITFGILSPKYANAQTYNKDLATIKSWTIVDDRGMTSYLKACEYFKENLSDTTRVVCRKPEIFYMYSGYHHSIAMPRFGSPDTILNFFINNNIEYVIMDSWFRHAFYAIWPCIMKYPDKFKLIQEVDKGDDDLQINPTYIMQFNNKWGYTGDIVNGKWHGQGVWCLQDGRTYKGHFANGLPNGYGEISDETGLTIKGIWKDGNLVTNQGSYQSKMK